MAAGGGFTFGQSTNTGFGTTNPGFGGTNQQQQQQQQQQQPSSGGFSFGAANPSTAPSTGGFSFAGQPAAKAATATATSFPFGMATTAASTGAFSFGATTTPAGSGGFSLGNTAPTAPSGGFSLGNTAAQAAGGGFSLGNTAAQAAGGGFSLGNTAAQAAGGGFSLGNTAAPAAGGGFSLGNAAAAAAAPSGGFSLGNAAAAANRGGLMFGTPPTATSTAAPVAPVATANAPFSFGSAQAPASSAPTFGTPPTQAATGGLLGFKPQGSVAPTPSSGLASNLNPNFSFGQQTTTSVPSFGGLGAASTTTTPSFSGFSFPKTTTATGLTLGGNTGFGIGGTSFLSSATTAPTSITGSIPTAQVISKGLGGVDPKVSAGISDGTGQNGKQINSKALKESQLPNQLGMCVEPLKKYIKHEKTIRENISRMTDKSMKKIQVEMAALRQILGTVSNGVQRNAVAVEKLKKETVQELKNTEMGQRTEEISAVLQDENTAPTEYFQHLFEDFEVQMKAYKVEIQNLESHIMSLHQPSRLTPEELTMLLRKSHENFLALAALFHQVHESVKTLKEKYLNYRRIFLGDTKDIFELKKKASSRTDIPALESQQGPNPFSGFPRTTAIALAAALSRNQLATTAPPAMGLGTSLGQPTGFGSAFGTQPSLFTNTGTGGGLFGNTNTNQGYTGFGTTPSQAPTSSTGFSFGGSNTAAVKPLGSLLGSSGGMFGGGVSTAAVPNTGTTQLPQMTAAAPTLDAGGAFAFGGGAPPQQQQQPLLQLPLQPGSTSSLSPTGQGTQFGVQNRPFQLQKPPPPASKRGKR